MAPLRDGTTGIAPIARTVERNSRASHAMSANAVRRFGQTLQKQQRRRKLVRLARCQKEIDQPPGSVTHADDLGAKPASRPAHRLRLRTGAASESQTQRTGLLDRAPAAF